MEMLKLLIADAGEEFRLALAEQTRGSYRVRICQEGRETLQTVLSFKPDLMVLDMMLPGMDGISILEAAAEEGIYPTVLAITKYSSDYLVESAQRLNVGYLMMKPCDVGITAARLQDMTRHLDTSGRACPDPRAAVSNMLLTLGISTKLRGYGYLREAILETMRCPGQMVTKELYPKVGKRCNASAIQVERSVRSAIDKAWKQRNEDAWNRYFSRSAEDEPERPTNSVFISCLAERIKLEQG